MPTWCTNWMEIKGDAENIRRLVEKSFVESDRGKEFSFNGVIPMPPEVMETVEGIVVDTQEQADDLNRKHRERWGHHIDKGISPVIYITQAEHDRRIAEYGHTDWYGWSVANWGTKWDASNTEVLNEGAETIAIRFETAWCFPEPVADELVRQGFTVYAMWQREGFDGHGEYGEGWDMPFERTVIYRGEEG